MPAGAVEPSRAGLDKKVENVQLLMADGKKILLYDLSGKRATVVVFLSFDCPVSNSYVPALNEMAGALAAKDVVIVGFCGGDLNQEQVTARCKEYALAFPVFADKEHRVVEAFQAVVTPEAFLLDNGRTMRYRGRIDDAYSTRLKRNREVSTRDLRAAIDQLLSGQPIQTRATVAVGCPIPRIQAKKAASGPVTFHRDVLPILQNHCQTCHRPGEIGPFSLMSYSQAVNWAADIKQFTSARKMPPWMPTEGGPFLNERKLREKEIATLAAWVDAGMPEGNVADAPKPRRFVEGWQLGKPDLILGPDSDMVVGASGKDMFRSFVLPTKLKESRYVIGYEVRPGNPRVVHHAVQFLDTRGWAGRLEQRERERTKSESEIDRGPGYSSRMGPGFLPQGDVGGWAPGITPHFFPPGVAYYLPPNSDVVMQLHYHRTGKVERDRTQVGFYFAKEPVKNVIQPIVIPGYMLGIPAGADNFRVRGSVWIDRDCTIYNVTPHMHLIGKKIKITMTPPGGPATILVGIDQWDFNWQEIYFFKQPIAVKAGTKFSVEAIYDNSANNPANPNNPPKIVRIGEETTNEMCFGFADATSNDGELIGFRLRDGGFAIKPPRLMPKK